VIGRAEALPLGDNPRFIVTSLQPATARVKVAMASAFPHQHEFALAHALLGNAGR
jgi:hypothetical protein